MVFAAPLRRAEDKENSVNKTELIEAVAAHTGNAKSTVAEVLAGLEDVVVATVNKGEKVAQPPDWCRNQGSCHEGSSSLRWCILQEGHQGRSQGSCNQELIPTDRMVGIVLKKPPWSPDLGGFLRPKFRGSHEESHGMFQF